MSRNRRNKYPAKVYLNDEEHEKLEALCRACGYSKSAYLRSLLKLVEPKPLPTADYHRFTRQLAAIGNNFNQIARVANTTGDIHYEEYQQAYQQLQKQMLEIRRKLQIPEGIVYGNHKN